MSTGRPLTRGPLPASVYWRRRAAVVGTILLLIFATVRMFTGDDSAANGAEELKNVGATPAVVPAHVGAETAPSAGASAGAAAATPTPGVGASAAATAPAVVEVPTPAPLPAPTGRCSDGDVEVSAEVGTAVAGRNVPITLSLRTGVQLACLWEFGSKTVQVQVTSGSDRIWTSVECGAVLPKRSLTLRRDTPVTVTMEWNSRRSDEKCTNRTKWALPGTYHLQTAALGGEPASERFKLYKPSEVPAPKKPAVVATEPTPKPATKPTPKPATKPATQPAAKPSTPTAHSTDTSAVRDEPTAVPRPAE